MKKVFCVDSEAYAAIRSLAPFTHTVLYCGKGVWVCILSTTILDSKLFELSKIRASSFGNLLVVELSHDISAIGIRRLNRRFCSRKKTW